MKKDTNDPGLLKYKWTCLNLTDSRACKFANGTDLNIPDEPLYSIPANLLWVGSQMQIKLSVEKSSQFDMTYVIINIIQVSKVSVGIKTPEEGIKVNRDKVVILSAAAYSTMPYNLKYFWKSVPELPLSSFANGVNEKFLKINPYILEESQRYMFTCTVTDTDGSSADANIRVSVNRPPRFGSFEVTPNNGVSGETRFELKASGWIDDDLPLRYLFSYLDSTTNSYIPLNSRSEINQISSLIYSNNGIVNLRLEIFDSLNASSTVNQQITLLNPSKTTSQLLDSAADTSKTEFERLSILNSISSTIDCTILPFECQKLFSAIDTVDRGFASRTLESDLAIIKIVNSVNNLGQGEHLSTVMEILSRISSRERENIGTSLSIYEEQFERKKIKYGLSDQETKIMSNLVSKVLDGMSDIQVFNQQEGILETTDVISRSLLKDAVPSEKPVVLENSGISIIAQKVASCSDILPVISNGSMKGVGYSIPICDILPINQTVFENKTLNRYLPYDVIIQVYERNVIGDCTPLPTKLLRVMIYDDYTKSAYSVQNALKGINFTFDLDPNFPEDELGKVTCVYYEQGEEDFTPRTLNTTLIDITLRRFRCMSYHLTEFTLKYMGYDIEKAYLSTEFLVLMGVMLFCIITNAWAIYFDPKDKVDNLTMSNEMVYEFMNSQQIQGNEINQQQPSPKQNIQISTYTPCEQSNFPAKIENRQPPAYTKSKKYTIANISLNAFAIIILVFFSQIHTKKAYKFIIKSFLHTTKYSLSKSLCPAILEWNFHATSCLNRLYSIY